MLSEQQLNHWVEGIKTMCLKEGVLEDAFSGQCDAFAIAFYHACKEKNIRGKLVRIERQRHWQGVGALKPVECNPLSHVVVEVILPNEQGFGQKNICIDAGGVDADIRWEEQWVQPFERPDADEEEEQQEDFFYYHALSKKELKSLRVQQDGREVDQSHVSMYEHIVKQSWPQPVAPLASWKTFMNAVQITHQQCRKKNKNIF